jgi:hypothetical protein
MDERIKLNVNKIIVHKRIHEYLGAIAEKKSQTKEENGGVKHQEASELLSNGGKAAEKCNNHC